MARIFPTVVRRIVNVVAGGAGFIASRVNVGLRMSNQIRLIGGTARVAVRLSSRLTLTSRTFPAIRTVLAVAGTITTQLREAFRVSASPTNLGRLSSIRDGMRVTPSLRAFTGTQVREAIRAALSPATGTAGLQLTDAGLRAQSRISEMNTPVHDAVNVVQITYGLTRTAGGDTATNVTGTWTNPTNATGAPNATYATSAGAAVGGSRKLRLDYADAVGKTELTITQVELLFYVGQSGDPTRTLASIALAYNVGAGEVVLATLTGGPNAAVPSVYDVTAAIGGDWAKINALQTFVTHTYAAASALVTCSLDAVTVRITASATQTI